MLRNFKRLLRLFVDISITPLTRRKVERKFSAQVRDPSLALSFHAPEWALPFGTPASPASKVTKNRLRLSEDILDISSLRASSDLYGEPEERSEPAWERASERRPTCDPFRVLLSRDSSQLPPACKEALHLGERDTFPLVCHSCIYFLRYFPNFKLKNVKEGWEGAKETNIPYPIVFSFDSGSAFGRLHPLLNETQTKETPKNRLGENFIFVWVRQSPCTKNKNNNNNNNKTKNSRQFWSHGLRYASLITCLRNSFLIGQMSNQDRSRPSNNEAGPSLVTSEPGIVSRYADFVLFTPSILTS